MSPIQHLKKTARAVHTFALTAFILWSCPLTAHASGSLESTVSNFLSYLTGTLGKTLAGLAIVSVGFGCFVLGRVPKEYVIAVVVGVGLVFGCNALVSQLS